MFDLTRRQLAAGTVLLGGSAPASAQGWAPTRPMRIVVPFAPGGATDVVARVLAERLTERLGQPVTVDNRTGAGGNVGVEHVVRGTPDGHTLLMGTTGTLTINPHLYPALGFDPRIDLAPVSMAFATDHVLIVHPAVPAETLEQFLALAHSKPGALSYGSAGNGSSTHMVPELFRLIAGIELQHVPYRGSAPALNDTVAGNVQCMLDQLPSAIGMIQAGRVRALAVTGPQRSPLLPDVPTLAEGGLAAAQATSWGAIMVPAATPQPAIDRLNATLVEVLAQPAVRERLAAAGAGASPSTQAGLAAVIATETVKWGRVVREARVTVN